MDNDDFVLLDKEDVQDFNEENLLPQSPASRTSILAWLDPTKYDEDGGEFKKHLYAHTAGTNEWILGLNTWKDWYESTALGLLWIKGIPGSGKSVAAANLVQRLKRENENALVLYFFFRQIIDANHSPESCIRDWLAQTLPYSPALQAELSKYVKESRDLSTFSREDLWKLLRLGLVHQKKAFVVADALDEMDSGNEAFINELAQMSRWRPANVKILLTSRPTNAMENAFRSTDVLQIRLEEKQVDTDISTFVSSCLKKTSISAGDQTLIRQAIPGHANGLFLYARLAMDALLKPGIIVRETLDDIPTNLNSMFNSLLHEHANRSGVSLEFQMAVLQWVTHATRPLRLLELSEILHNVYGKSYGYSLKDVKTLVRSSCGPLVEVLPDESLSVVHHSLTEFLKGWTRESMPLSSDGYIFPVFEPGPTNLILARACLHYLQWANLKTSKEKVSKGAYDLGSDPTLYDLAREIRFDRPFAIYAASSWNVHVSRALAGTVSTKDAEGIHNSIDLIFANVLEHKALQTLLFSTKKLENCSAIHLAAKIGLADYVERILKRNPSLQDSRDAKNRTPLHFAAELGHSGTVKVLLQHGADPDPDQAHGYKPLHYAARKNHHETVRLLLEAGVDPLTQKTRETPGRRCGNARRTTGETALMYACDFGHLDALNAFIPFLKPDAVVKALAWSAKSGRTALVRQILFRTAVKVDALYRGDSALYLACCGPHFKVITLLIDAGADPNLHCTGAGDEFRGGLRMLRPNPDPKLGRRNTPLQAFVSSMHRLDYMGQTLTEFLANVKVVLGRLINAGGNVNAQDYQGNSPLHRVIQCSDSDEIALSIAEVLVEAGCDVNMANDKGEIPLHKCLNDQTGKILRLLIEKGGADINQKDADGRAPLIAILKTSGICSYSPATILQVLAFKPDLDVADSDGNSILHLVVEGNRHVRERPRDDSDADPDEEVMDALIASGLNPNRKNNAGKTPLHLFQFGPQFHKTLLQDERIIEKIVKAGADLEAKDWHGRTVLFSQISKSKNGIRAFIDAGCRVDARDEYGRSLLHECMKENHRGGNEQEILRLLLSEGLDPSILDYDGNTLFHELAIHEQEVRQRNLLSFLKPLVSPDQANYAGQTPLHIATSYAPRHGSYPLLFDALLDICEHKDVADANLVTPLHIAASISDLHVKRLLNSGADVTAVTKNGFTVLHLASRARQSNTIGMLCEHLTKTDKDGVQRLIDARDDAGRTALHYASRSGRLESVELLLQYGADPNIRDSEDKTALEVCVEFEGEQTYWKTWPKQNTWGCHVRIGEAKYGDGHWLKPDITGRLTYERRHIQVDHDTVRLEEIIETLMAHSPYASFEKDQWQVTLESILMKAVERNYEYTYHCFLHLAERLGISESMQAASYGWLWEEQRRTFEQELQWNGAELPTDEMISQIVSDMLYCRRFDLVRQFMKSADRRTLLVCQDIFVRWGYSVLLNESLDYSLSLPKIKSLDFEADKLLNEKLLLIKACQRDLPNVAALKTIIHHEACSVNEQFKNRPHEGTALYALARGVEWWQVEQGLPCLLDAGADIDLIDDDYGNSALHCAFAYDISQPYRRLQYPKRSYGDRAAEILIERGANVNILTVSGQPCLALTDNLDIISMLLKRGAKLSTSALFGPVTRGKPETLRILLSAGIDPNKTVVRIRKETNHRVDWETDRIGWISDDHESEYRRGLEEESPFHFATDLKNPYWAWRRNEPCESDADLELIRTFIEHGADLTLRLTRRPPKNSSGLDLGLDDGDGPISTTLIHSVMYEGGCAGPLLDVPGLDLEMRDSIDRTLFLAACCKSQPTFRGSRTFAEEGVYDARDYSLLENLHARGADIKARDIGGNNALHLLLGYESFDGDAKHMIKKLVETEPGLINQPNSKNLTPFHFALRFRSYTNNFVDAMIDAGADVTLPDNAGNNVLHYMGQMDEFIDFVFLRKLLSKGVDINSRNLKGETMLHLHLANRSWNLQRARPYHGERDHEYVIKVFECLTSLIDAGADVFAKNKAGDTMLHVIAAGFSGETGKKSAAVRCFRFFMDLGLDPLTENEGQSTSLDVAAANGNTAILEMFQKDGGVEEGGEMDED